MSYEHFVRITSQLPFCSTPVRLDAYNHCQFACGYCFARSRLGFGRDTTLQNASAKALRARLARVSQGELSSALDEFLEQRIPVQLGGMSDPFMAAELDRQISLELISALRDDGYPFLISTKGSLPSEDRYRSILQESQVLVRFSITGVSSEARDGVDRGTVSHREIFRTIQQLSDAGVPTSVRIQPLFPGHERAAADIIRAAASAGARHVSIEYLKVPLEADRSFSPAIGNVLGGKPIAAYISAGAIRRGREYILPSGYRIAELRELRDLARSLGMSVGLADNDLLHFSDGGSCCNGVAKHLPGTRVFKANVSAALSTTKPGDYLHFGDIKAQWSPMRDISPYLNSQARLPREGPDRNWGTYLTKIWEGTYGVHSPDSFLGIEATGTRDEDGNRIFVRKVTLLD